MAHWIDTIRHPASGGAGKMHRRYTQGRFGGWTFATLLSTVVETVLEWQKRGHERRQLLELDDRMLKDIGISRAEATEEGRKPFCPSEPTTERPRPPIRPEYRLVMYIPPKFAENDPAVLWSFVDQYPFAIMIAEDTARGLLISHVPVIRSSDENAGDAGAEVHGNNAKGQVLYTHLAAANPQARIADGTPVALVFSGPHGYVSPTWYETQPAVPTWNYAAVHVSGIARPVLEQEARHDVMRSLAQRFEAPAGQALDFDQLPGGFRDSQMKGIVAFEIAVAAIIGKFKLSQNRPAEDRKGVVHNLQLSNRPEDRALAALMTTHSGIV